MVVSHEVMTKAARSSAILGDPGEFPPIAPQESRRRSTDQSLKTLVRVVANVATAPLVDAFTQRVADGLLDFAAALRLLQTEKAHQAPVADFRSARIEHLARIEREWGASLRHEMQHAFDTRLAALRVAQALNANPCPPELQEAENNDAQQFAGAVLLAAFMAEVIDVSVEIDGANVESVHLASDWHREAATAMYVTAMTSYERRYDMVDDEDDEDLTDFA